MLTQRAKAYFSKGYSSSLAKGDILGFFNFDIKKIIVFSLLIILPIFSISLLKPGDRLWIFRPLSHIVGFSQNIFYGFTKSIQDTTKRYIDLVDINKEIQSLRSENSNLKARLLTLDEIYIENQRLSKILDFQSREVLSIVPAQVTGMDIFAERSSIRVNRGIRHGVKKGQAVITSNAAVGYVLEAHENSSVVLVLTDRYAVIDAILQESRARGIVEGYGIDSTILKYLQRSDEVKVGDLVVTSGLDNIFPKGIPIARVRRVLRKKSEISPNVELTPIIDVTRLDEVFIVLDTNNHTKDQSSQTLQLNKPDFEEANNE